MKVVYIDLDGVLCEFEGAYERARKSKPEMAYPQAEYGFYANLEPISGGIEAVKMMLEDDRYSPYILTAPSEHNPMSYTEKRVWVEKHLGMEMVSRLIICPDKSLLRGDILIDDKMSGKGQENFEGVIVAYGSDDCSDWTAVLQFLTKDDEQ